MTAPAAAVTLPRAARSPGWWGMLAFMATETTLFGVLLGSYFYLRVHALTWPPPGVPHPAATVPLILSAVLFVTVLPVHLASRWASNGLLNPCRLALLVAFVVQCGYVAMTIHLYSDDITTLQPVSAGVYSSIYLTLVGADIAHVLVGLLLSAWFLLRLASGLTRYRVAGVQSIALYWYFVCVLTVVVTVVSVAPTL